MLLGSSTLTPVFCVYQDAHLAHDLPGASSDSLPLACMKTQLFMHAHAAPVLESKLASRHMKPAKLFRSFLVQGSCNGYVWRRFLDLPGFARPTNLRQIIEGVTQIVDSYQIPGKGLGELVKHLWTVKTLLYGRFQRLTCQTFDVRMPDTGWLSELQKFGTFSFPTFPGLSR